MINNCIQKVDGSWDEKILEVCEKTEEEVLKFIPDNVKKCGDKEQQLIVMYTWIGINRLRTQCKNNEDEWKLIVKKSEEFLEKESAFKGKYADIECKLFEKDDEDEPQSTAATTTPAQTTPQATTQSTSQVPSSSQIPSQSISSQSIPSQSIPSQSTPSQAQSTDLVSPLPDESSTPKKKKNIIKRIFSKLFGKKNKKSNQ